MDDERMDAQLHEYATRWRVGDARAPAALGAAASRRRSVLLPALTAAAVVATVVGVGLTQRDTAQRPPVTGPTPPVSPAAATPCSTIPDDRNALRWSAGFAYAHDHHVSGNLVGELRVTNMSPVPCTVPDDVRITVRHNVTAVDVPYEDTPTPAAGRTIGPGTGMVKALTWTAPLPVCAAESTVVVLLVETGGEGFRLPVDHHVFPTCRTPEHRATGIIRAQPWARLPADAPCAIDEWGAEARIEALHVLKHEGTGKELRGVQITVDFQNNAGRPCDIDVKPLFYIVANGRRLHTSQFTTKEGRTSPPLLPGGRARAELFWSSYCGPRLDDYEIYVEIPGRPGAVPLMTTGAKSVPECHGTDDPDSVGQTSSGWIEPL